MRPYYTYTVIHRYHVSGHKQDVSPFKFQIIILTNGELA